MSIISISHPHLYIIEKYKTIYLPPWHQQIPTEECPTQSIESKNKNIKMIGTSNYHFSYDISVSLIRLPKLRISLTRYFNYQMIVKFLNESINIRGKKL